MSPVSSSLNAALKRGRYLGVPDAAHLPETRFHDGVPSLAASPVNGRLWSTWYASPTGCEDANNYVVLSTSADSGATWKEVLVYDPDGNDPGGAVPTRAFDPELWVAPDGRLRWTWTERAVPQEYQAGGMYAGCHAPAADDRLMLLELDAENEPDAAALSPDDVRQIARGVMMCKPTVLSNGAWLFPVAHWGEAPSACVYETTDGGRTFAEVGGVTLPESRRQFDEHQIVELRDGTLRAYIRTNAGPDGLWVAESADKGRTWGDPRPANLPHVNSRVFVARLASGNLLLVKNGRPGEAGDGRKDMTAYLSADDGRSWPFALVLDAGRTGVAYPDGQQLPDGRIAVAFDFGRRVKDREIVLSVFTEDDIRAGKFVSPASRPRQLIYCRDGLVPDIDTGRQLFVDDFLVGKAVGVVRHWNAPVKVDAPVVWPADGAAPLASLGEGQPVERTNLTCATDGGLWWDPTRRKFRLWYQARWIGRICYAESDDGLSWTYPDLGVVPGTNLVDAAVPLDSWTVSPDWTAANPYSSWKLHVSAPGGISVDQLLESEDGVHFRMLGVAGHSCDRSTSYYDPFRKVWVFSLRDWRPPVGRTRRYFASRKFGGEDCRWTWPGKGTPGVDGAGPEPEKWLDVFGAGVKSLYNFDAVAYESVMLGVMEILHNTPGDNGDCMKVGLPKQTSLHFCFSRDGKTFVPREEPDIAPSGWGSGKWDTGYLSPTGGICVIRDERLWFYYSGLRGDGECLEDSARWWMNGMYSNGAIGVATLRRDGFAGMVADGRGEIVTRPVAFTGKRLFVNADCLFGSVSAEILDVAGTPVPGYSEKDCTPLVAADSTRTPLDFAGGDLSRFAHRAVRIRFVLRCAALYSFWVSASGRGESGGYVAAGGPDYPGLRDVHPSA